MQFIIMQELSFSGYVETLNIMAEDEKKEIKKSTLLTQI